MAKLFVPPPSRKRRSGRREQRISALRGRDLLPKSCPMDMKLRPFDFAQAAARAGLAVNGTPLAPKPAATGGASFGDAMTQALKNVSASQNEAARLQREVQLDNPTVSLEETMV